MGIRVFSRAMLRMLGSALMLILAFVRVFPSKNSII